MGKIDPFLPMDRRQVAGGRLPLITKGAALFADISGFTSYSFNLELELGTQLSTEELTAQLNQVYEALINPVHDYGGSVISFGGDAILCWFDGDNGRAATACALEMQAQMSLMEKGLKGEADQSTLGIKIAITSGRARRFLVGQPRIQRMEVLAGEIITRLAAAEKQLKSGEVVVGSEVMAWFGPEAIVNEWRKDENNEYFAVVEGINVPVEKKPWPEPPEIDLDKVSEWLLQPVFHQLVSGEAEFLAELRSAVAIFIKFDGIDFESDDYSEKKLDAYIGWVQRILAKYQGHVLQVTVGDKGSYLNAAFGALMTHEDEVDRALAAVMVLKSPPKELNYIKNIQIGVTRGNVRVGPYGAPSRQTYGVHGNEVNIAAKIMSQASPNQILTSRRIMVEASKRFEFKEKQAIFIKGIDEPFPMFELVSEVPEWATDVLGRSVYPIIARSKERDILDKGLRRLQDGFGSMVLIEGEAGMGKTRLVEYLLQQKMPSEVITLIGNADEIGQSSIYNAWRPIFNQLLNPTREPSVGRKESFEERRKSVYEKLNEMDSELVQSVSLLNAVLPFDFPENELTMQMTGEVRANNIQALLVKLLSITANKNPLLLVIDDAHWMDSASWALVQLVNREVNPLLFIILQRPFRDVPPLEYSNLHDNPKIEYLQLNILSKDEVETFTKQRLGVNRIPPEVVNFVYDRAEGNPLFSEELIIALRDRGHIAIVGDECKVISDLRELELLDSLETIQAIIRSRIDQLNPREQEILKISGIIGRVFNYRILYDISPFDKTEPVYLQEYLDNLESLDLIQLESPEPNLAYKFKHHLTWEVAYNSMLFSQRREYHFKTAEWYEKNYFEDLPEVYPLLAYHWGHTDYGEKAIEFLVKAGEQAVRNFANREAVTFYSQAINRANKDRLDINEEYLAQWELILGEAFVNLGEHQEGREHLERGLDLLGQPIPKGTLRQGINVFVQIMLQLRNRIWQRRYLGGQSKNRDTLLAASRASEKLAEVYFIMNETMLALFTAFRTLNLAEAAGSSSELARGYATLGALVGFVPLHNIAINYLNRARETVDRLDDMIARTWVYLVLGFYYAGVGNWQEATNLQNQVVEISKRIGDQRREEDGLGNLFALNYFQGNFRQGFEYAERMVEVSRRRSSDFSLAYGLQGKGFISLHMGQFDNAMNSLNELLSMIEKENSKVTDESLKLESYGLLSQIHLRLGNIKPALEMAEKSIELSTNATPSNYSAFSGYAGPALVYLSLFETAQESSDYRKDAWKACKLLRKYARVFPIGESRAWLYAGWYHWLTGNHSKAHKAWKSSLASARRLSMLYDEGLVYLELGRHSLPEDRMRNEYISKGIDIFTKVGALHDLERSKDLI